MNCPWISKAVSEVFQYMKIHKLGDDNRIKFYKLIVVEFEAIKIFILVRNVFTFRKEWPINKTVTIGMMKLCLF